MKLAARLQAKHGDKATQRWMTLEKVNAVLIPMGWNKAFFTRVQLGFAADVPATTCGLGYFATLYAE